MMGERICGNPECGVGRIIAGEGQYALFDPRNVEVTEADLTAATDFIVCEGCAEWLCDALTIDRAEFWRTLMEQEA